MYQTNHYKHICEATEPVHVIVASHNPLLWKYLNSIEMLIISFSMILGVNMKNVYDQR